VSRRALRSGGVRGSNESLNALARQFNAEFASEQAGDSPHRPVRQQGDHPERLAAPRGT
jgi:hypothetical protein